MTEKYNVVSTSESHTIIRVGESVYQVASATWADLQGMIDNGLADVSILAVVSKVTASAVKEFDQEKAKRAAKRAERDSAIALFETELAAFSFSKKVASLGRKIKKLRNEVADLETTPLTVSLGEYSEVNGLVREAGQYSFRHVVRNNQRIALLEIAPTDALPLVDKRNKLDIALNAFRVSCANEVGTIVPETLKETLKLENFDITPEGEMVINWRAKRASTGSGGTRKGKGYYTHTLYPDQQFATATELGKLLSPAAKYPHKSVTGQGAALDKGDAAFHPATEDATTETPA